MAFQYCDECGIRLLQGFPRGLKLFCTQACETLNRERKRRRK